MSRAVEHREGGDPVKTDCIELKLLVQCSLVVYGSVSILAFITYSPSKDDFFFNIF